MKYGFTVAPLVIVGCVDLFFCFSPQLTSLIHKSRDNLCQVISLLDRLDMSDNKENQPLLTPSAEVAERRRSKWPFFLALGVCFLLLTSWRCDFPVYPRILQAD
jgi:hypothetical protein